MHWSRPARAPGASYCARTGDEVNIDAAIVGIGCSTFGRGLPDSQLRLAAVAFKDALADAGLQRSDVDGLSIHLGWPLGVDYDRIAEGFGLDIRYVNQSWLHGRFVTNALQHAALAVSAGLADVVACVTAVSFTRERGFLGGPLLSEAHVAGWNSICEMVSQLRGAAGVSQIANAAVLQWGTAWGDSFILAA